MIFYFISLGIVFLCCFLLRLCFDIHTAIAAATIFTAGLNTPAPNVLTYTLAPCFSGFDFEEIRFRFGNSEADYG